MNFLHSRLDRHGEELVEVSLSGRANVMLPDDANISNHSDRRPFEYHGGLATKSPVWLSSRPGKWHLVIDLGGYAGSASASVCTILTAA